MLYLVIALLVVLILLLSVVNMLFKERVYLLEEGLDILVQERTQALERQVDELNALRETA